MALVTCYTLANMKNRVQDYSTRLQSVMFDLADVDNYIAYAKREIKHTDASSFGGGPWSLESTVDANFLDAMRAKLVGIITNLTEVSTGLYYSVEYNVNSHPNMSYFALDPQGGGVNTMTITAYRSDGEVFPLFKDAAGTGQEPEVLDVFRVIAAEDVENMTIRDCTVTACTDSVLTFTAGDFQRNTVHGVANISDTAFHIIRKKKEVA